MGTIRVAKRNRFTPIDRRTINDRQLSFRARGVLHFLLDKPEGWKADSELLTVHTTEGRDAIRSALRELEEFGYLVRRKWRDSSTGQWVSEHIVYERPSDAEEASDDDVSSDEDQGGFSALATSSPDATSSQVDATAGNPAVANQRRLTSAGFPGPLIKTVKKTVTNPLPPLCDDANGAPRRRVRSDSNETATARYQRLGAHAAHTQRIAESLADDHLEIDDDAPASITAIRSRFNRDHREASA